MWRGRTRGRSRRSVPWDSPLLACRRATLQVCGIMNGTTNFMLSKMESEGAAYEDVLKEAQALGFAEGKEMRLPLEREQQRSRTR